MSVVSLLLITFPILTLSLCPFASAPYETPTNGRSKFRAPSLYTYNKALDGLDVEEVIADLTKLLTDNQDCWPADTFCTRNQCDTSYAGLFIRLAWHCSGTYRTTDGVGGCSGGRIRFDPERSMEDNTNLDKARALLWPIKLKYGDALSWGDLIVLAGSSAILAGGGPIDSVCVGRVDDVNGDKSLPLVNVPCEVQGDCRKPLGTSTIGLIYVNPQGYLGKPDPVTTASHIREVFGRMGMNDTETVALIGGGHAFGKAHGACPEGAGHYPWQGLCGSGKGRDTFTSGLEGQWTTYPFKWDNEFFEQLMNDEYTLVTSPANAFQWRNQRTGWMMLTTDIALVHDAEYKEISQRFAEDLNYLSVQFGAVWKKLTESGGRWAYNRKCVDIGKPNPRRPRGTRWA